MQLKASAPSPPVSGEPVCAGLGRRLLASLYDALLLGSLILFATVPVLLVTGGHAVEPGNRWFQLYLLVLAFGYFAWSWTHGGQTLGAKSWRIAVVRLDGRPVGAAGASLRFVWCLVSLLALGLGFAWSIADRYNRGWPDLFTNTRLVRVNKS